MLTPADMVAQVKAWYIYMPCIIIHAHIPYILCICRAVLSRFSRV